MPTPPYPHASSTGWIVVVLVVSTLIGVCTLGSIVHSMSEQVAKPQNYVVSYLKLQKLNDSEYTVVPRTLIVHGDSIMARIAADSLLLMQSAMVDSAHLHKATVHIRENGSHVEPLTININVKP